jgi:hypothetical protein
MINQVPNTSNVTVKVFWTSVLFGSFNSNANGNEISSNQTALISLHYICITLAVTSAALISLHLRYQRYNQTARERQCYIIACWRPARNFANLGYLHGYAKRVLEDGIADGEAAARSSIRYWTASASVKFDVIADVRYMRCGGHRVGRESARPRSSSGRPQREEEKKWRGSPYMWASLLQLIKKLL